MSNAETYVIQRMTDKAYLTAQGGFSLDRRKAREFGSFADASTARSAMRVITATYISRGSLLAYV